MISVRDGGIGIPAADLLHVFDRFYRVPGVEVQTGSSIGLGLGLYISQQIVEKHGGRIMVESTPGIGSIFSIILPVEVNTGIDVSNLKSYSRSLQQGF